MFITLMRIKVGVMGSAGDAPPDEAEELRAKAEGLGRAIAARGCVVLTGGTTGLPHLVGAAAHKARTSGVPADRRNGPVSRGPSSRSWGTRRRR